MNKKEVLLQDEEGYELIIYVYDTEELDVVRQDNGVKNTKGE